jgi:hypothetical protein
MTDVKTGRVVPYLTEMFRFQVWVALGKVAHPMSGEVERDLDGARAAIDLLSELETRTAGNRSDEESKLMQAVLTELRMNYVDEMNKPAPAEVEASDAAAEASGEVGAGSSDDAGAKAAADDTGAQAAAGDPDDSGATADAADETAASTESDSETTRA